MKRDELPALTGARFYAAFLVFLNHVIFLYFKERFAGMRVVDFAVGVCLGIAMLRNGRALQRCAGLLQAAGLLGLAAAVVLRAGSSAWSHDSMVLMPGVVLLILGLASGRGALVRHLSHPWIRLMGLSSFAFYMLHHLVLRYMKALMRVASVEPAPVEAAAWVVGAFLATCALSYVAYARFEMPVQQAMRRWLAGRSPHPSR